MNDTVPINNPHRMRDQKITHAFDLEGIAPGGSPAIGHSRARTEMATCNKTNNICRYPLLGRAGLVGGAGRTRVTLRTGGAFHGGRGPGTPPPAAVFSLAARGAARAGLC